MNVVAGFKSKNRGGDDVIAGPWAIPNNMLAYVRMDTSDGSPHLVKTYMNGRGYKHVTPHPWDLIPATREVKDSELKVGDRITHVDGILLGYISTVRLGRTGANGVRLDSWVGDGTTTYTIEDNQ